MIRGETHKAWSVVILSAALAGCLLAALLWTTASAEAAGRYKTVTRTFSNTDRIAIPDTRDVHSPYAATPYPSEKNVGGLKKGKILDVNLTLKNFSHTFPIDVDVMVSHRGVNRTVMSDVGTGEDASGATLRLDDEAAEPMGDAVPVSGTFKPTNLEDNNGPDVFPAPAPIPSDIAELSGFDGSNPNGPWSLWVADDSGADGGRFAGGWSVTIKARVLR